MDRIDNGLRSVRTKFIFLFSMDTSNQSCIVKHKHIRAAIGKHKRCLSYSCFAVCMIIWCK